MKDHEKYRDIKNKYKDHFSEKPAKKINMQKKKKTKKKKNRKKKIEIQKNKKTKMKYVVNNRQGIGVLKKYKLYLKIK